MPVWEVSARAQTICAKWKLLVSQLVKQAVTYLKVKNFHEILSQLLLHILVGVICLFFCSHFGNIGLLFNFWVRKACRFAVTKFCLAYIGNYIRRCWGYNSIVLFREMCTGVGKYFDQWGCRTQLCQIFTRLRESPWSFWFNNKRERRQEAGTHDVWHMTHDKT